MLLRVCLKTALHQPYGTICGKSVPHGAAQRATAAGMKNRSPADRDAQTA